jgi:hypothetical protein
MAQGDSTGDTSQAKEVDPTDNEDLGDLAVSYPAGTPVLTTPPYVTYRGSAVTVGQNLRVTGGDGCVSLSESDPTVHFMVTPSACGVTVVKGQVTNYPLSSLAIRWDPSVLSRDFGPTPSFALYYTGSTAAGGTPTELQIGSSWTNPGPSTWHPFITLPGQYRVDWNIPVITGSKQSLTGGQTAQLDATPVDAAATIILKRSQRNFPDATPQGTYGAPARHFLIWAKNATTRYAEPASYDVHYSHAYSPGEGIADFQAFTLDADKTIRVFPFASTEAPNHYVYSLNGTTQTLNLTPGQTTTISVERLDVNDVKITDENGNTRFVSATYQVYQQGAGNVWNPVQGRIDGSSGAPTTLTFPTKTGIDVLTGTYKIVLSYTDAEGAKSQEIVTTVP